MSPRYKRANACHRGGGGTRHNTSLKALVEKPTIEPIPNNWKTGGYLDKLPRDPWGNPYQYLQPGVHGELDILSYGSYGQPGGTGNDADIGSWDQ